MRYALPLLLLLAGCATPEEIQARKIVKDQAYCAKLGITQSSPNFYRCMVYAEQAREARNTRAINTLLGAGSTVYRSQPQYTPPPAPMTCIQQGVFTNCY